MAALSIRDVDEDVRDLLRLRAARNGRSMEAEVRAILAEAVSETTDSANPFVLLMERFGEIGGVDLDLPPRSTYQRPVDLPE